MPELGIGWATEIAVLELSGSTVEDRGDHLVVRSPRSPSYHWGNCILVTDPDAADDADRWVGVFGTAFPSATWIAVGLTRMPHDPEPWREREVALEALEVLATRSVPRDAVPPEGYTVRRLRGDDWDETVRLSLDENELTGSFDAATYELFALARMEVTRAVCESSADVFSYFGAFADGELAASLGVVCCGTTARYQNVLTAQAHRRRGLASHLVGAAAGWAAKQGCDRWVIVTETTNPAGLVYRTAGFEPEGTYVQAYRPRPT
jgi:GNAT superfamily N-acetyltransferase